MLGIDARAARVTWTVFLFALGVAMVYLARESILIFTVAVMLAYMLSPMVAFVERRLPRRFSRMLALVVVYVTLLAVLLTLGAWLGARVAEEASNLIEQLPKFVREHRNLDSIPAPAWAEPFKARIVTSIRAQLDGAAEQVIPLLRRTFGGIAAVLGSLGFVILVPILTFLILKDAGDIRQSLLSSIPQGRNRALAEDIIADIHVLLAQYIRALVILSVVTSVVYIIFFEIIGLPYAVLLSVIAAPLEFIPFIGPLLGTVAILLVGVFTGFPHMLWIIVFFVIYRMFQDYVLQPYLMSAGIELHPLAVIFGAVAGQQIGGLWGMFLSVPILASLRIVWKHVNRVRVRKEPPAEIEVVS